MTALHHISKHAARHFTQGLRSLGLLPDPTLLIGEVSLTGLQAAQLLPYAHQLRAGNTLTLLPPEKPIHSSMVHVAVAIGSQPIGWLPPLESDLVQRLLQHHIAVEATITWVQVAEHTTPRIRVELRAEKLF